MAISFIRTIILYFVVVIGLRLMGKRQIGELEPSELVVAILISELAAIPMQDPGTPLVSGVLPIVTLLCLELLFSAIQIKSLRFRQMLCGKPSLVMSEGRILQKELRRNRLTTDELIEELRQKGVTDLATIKYAIVETNGQLSVIQYAKYKSPNAEDMSIQVEEPGLPVIIINDGNILAHNMSIRGLDMKWVDKEIKAAGLSNPKQVFLLLVDELNKAYIMPKESSR